MLRALPPIKVSSASTSPGERRSPAVSRWSSAQDFLGAAGAFLAAREAEHCLLFGLSSTIASHPEIYPDPRFWTVHEAERVVAAGLRTPPHNLILSLVDEPRWLTALAADVLASDQPPGVNAPADVARALADAWSARTGGTPVLVVQERIFRLDRVVPPRLAPGSCREAEGRQKCTAVHVIPPVRDRSRSP